jgi:hypothetical protein
VELAATYHVNESTIRKWRRETNATKVRARCASSGSDGRRRGQAERARQFDLQLYSWICAERQAGRPLRPAQVRAKARALASTYEQMGSFKASSGWYYRYCRRFGLTLDATASPTTSAAVSSSSGESGDVAGGVSEAMEMCAGTESMLELLGPFEFPVDEEDEIGDVFAAASGVSGAAARHSPVEPRSLVPSLVHEPEESAAACQGAIAHFLHHHAALLSRACRSRFIQHLADVPEELHAFAHMSSSERVQFAKTFAQRTSSRDTTKQSSAGNYIYRAALVV